MKTKEELNALRNEVEALNGKLAELTDEEMKQVTGGLIPAVPIFPIFGAAKKFDGISDGNAKEVRLNIDLGPEGYDCSGLVD